MLADRQRVLKRSRFAARLSIKLFILVAFLGLAPFILDTTLNEQMKNVHLVIKHPWTLVFPGLLAAGFLTLFIVCIVQKFGKPEINWLLTLNTVMLLVYGVMAYIRLLRFFNA